MCHPIHHRGSREVHVVLHGGRLFAKAVRWISFASYTSSLTNHFQAPSDTMIAVQPR